MIPSVAKLCEDVAKIIAAPLTEGGKLAAIEGSKAVAKAATKAITPVHQNIARYKDKNVYNNEDLVVVTVLAQMLYDKLLAMKINNSPLRGLKADTDSFPLSFFQKEAVIKADLAVHDTVKQIRAMRELFNVVIPGCIAALTATAYVDLKSLASKFSSMMIADGIVIRDGLDACKYGVEVCDKALKWAGQHDQVVNQWLRAHKLPATPL